MKIHAFPLLCLCVAAMRLNAFADDALPLAKYIAPDQVLDLPLAKLEGLKGKGAAVFGTNAEGKELVQVDYGETWFNLPDPVRAQYLVSSAAEHVVHQITLGFKDSVPREAIIAAAAKALGPAAQGESGPDAPSKYYAHWVRDSVRYDFQDYGDYREMYISRAPFSYSDQYKLAEPIDIIAQEDSKAKGVERRVMLLGKPRDDLGGVRRHYDSLWLYLCDPEHEEKGALTALPKESNLGVAPTLTLVDFTGDGKMEVLLLKDGHLFDVGHNDSKMFISGSADYGESPGACIYEIGARLKLLFDSGKDIYPTFVAEFRDNYKANIHINEDNSDHEVDIAGLGCTDSVYKDGKPQDQVKSKGYGYYMILAQDKNFDGVFELYCSQDARGACQADVIAFVTSIFTHRDGKFAATSVGVEVHRPAKS